VLDVHDPAFGHKLLEHVAVVILQQRLRSKLVDMEVVAFLGDGSILPRKSGASDSPMASPPAVPFKAPAQSVMSQSISVDVGPLSSYIPVTPAMTVDKTKVTISGLIVPGGITLICGGGYHGEFSVNASGAFVIPEKLFC
jgi:predicted ABC-class ATPase